MPPDEPDHLVDVHDAAAYLARLRGQPVAPGTIRSAASRSHIGRHGRRHGRTMYDLRELHRWAMIGIMDDLILWLRAQLDDDSQVAGTLIALGGLAPSDPLLLQTEFLARWDPDRVLREVAAKRRILDLHRPDTTRYVEPQCHECSGCGCCSVDCPCDTVKLLALPYADRDGYREEWSPARQLDTN